MAKRAVIIGINILIVVAIGALTVGIFASVRNRSNPSPARPAAATATAAAAGNPTAAQGPGATAPGATAPAATGSGADGATMRGPGGGRPTGGAAGTGTPAPSTGGAPTSGARPTGGIPAGGAPAGGAPAGGGTAVRVQSVGRDTLRSFVRTNGDVSTARELAVYPQVAGRLTTHEVRVGQTIAAGTPLLQIDPSRPGESYAISTLAAPIGGTVLSLPVQPGATVTTSTVVARIGDLANLRIETYVPERFLTLVRVGLPATVSFEALPGQTFPARIAELSPVVDPTTRTLQVSLTLDRRDPLIRPGMFATVQLVTAERPNVLVVPRSAVLSGYTDRAVFVLRADQTAERRVIQTGLETEQLIEITGGLTEGERVVVQGQSFLTGGDRVRVVQ